MRIDLEVNPKYILVTTGSVDTEDADNVLEGTSSGNAAVSV